MTSTRASTERRILPSRAPAIGVARLAPAPRSERQGFLRAVLDGLAAHPRALPSRWLYDAEGTRLFQRIMGLRTYYPTRVEADILARFAPAILEQVAGGVAAVVDLGAGDGTKTSAVLEAARRRSPGVAYAPVDVAAEALRAASRRMRAAFPDLAIRAELADYVEGTIRARAAAGDGALLALLLGGNLGNLEWSDAVGLLRDLRRSLRAGDHLLIGLDLLKEEEILRPAYDDDEGVTAAFNLNLLERIRLELGAVLDPAAFLHRATFDPVRPAMESWLVASRPTTVSVAGRRFEFAAGEAIHTEISWKYTEAQVGELARAAGFAEVCRHHDGRRWFVDALWRVPGAQP